MAALNKAEANARLARSTQDLRESQAQEEVAYLILDLLRTLRVSGRAAGRELGLARSQQGALQILIRNDGSEMKRLAQRLEVSQPTATVAVDSLVRDGLVERRPDERDGRIVRIFLTGKAKEIAKILREAQVREVARLTRSLSPKERANLQEVLEKMLGGDGQVGRE